MVKEDGTDVTVVTILLHKMGWVFFGIDQLVGLLDSKNRCIHNLVSGTIMIEA